MDHARFHQAWLAITMIEAQEMLVNMTLSDYPNMKAKDRKRIHKDMHKAAYFERENKAATVKDLNNMYGMGDISQVLKAKDEANVRSNSNTDRTTSERRQNLQRLRK